MIGLSLAYVIETTNVASYAVRKFSDVENFMTSFERVKVYTNLDAEPRYKIESMPPMNWPRDGHVSFTNVSLRYYPGGPQVLKDLRVSLPKTGPLRFGSENQFPLNFAHEYILVQK